MKNQLLLLTAFGCFATSARADMFHSGSITEETATVSRIDDCFTTGDTPHVCVLMRLADYESHYESDLEDLFKEYAAEVGSGKGALLSNPLYLSRLNALTLKYSKIAAKFKADITKMAVKKKSTALQLIANYELPRLQADLQSRLAIMCLPDKVAARAQLEKADKLIVDAFESFKSVPAKDREDTPGLLNRLVQTRLNILDLTQNASTDQRRLDPDFKVREDRTFLKTARALKPSQVESVELDLTELETYVSNAHARGIGDRIPTPPADPDDPDRMAQLINGLSASDKALKGQVGQEMLQAEVKLMNMKARFFSRAHQKNAFQELEANLKSSDVATQQTAATALNSLYSDFSGLSASRDLLLIAQRNEKVEGVDLSAMQTDFSQQAFAHDQAMDEALGELGPKLNLPTYKRVLEDQRNLGEPYLHLTASLNRLSGQLQTIKAAGGSEEDVKLALSGVDLDWIDLQCATIASRNLMRVGDEGLKIKTPFSRFTVDFTTCLGSKDARERGPIVHQISKNAINLDLYKNYAWQIGNFAFDVSTVLMTGGVGSVVNKGLTSGFRVAGKAMLRRYAAHTLIKAGTRSAAFVTKLVVGDLVGQTMGGLKTFVAVGLQTGDWDKSNLKPDFMKPDFSPSNYGLRLMAAQIATKAPWALFGRIGKVAMKTERMKKVVTALAKARPDSIAGFGAAYALLGKKFITDPIKGQVNSLTTTGLQKQLGLDDGSSLQTATTLDGWIGRYRKAISFLPGTNLADHFITRLHSLPPKYYGELAKAGKCIVGHSALTASNP